MFSFYNASFFSDLSIKVPFTKTESLPPFLSENLQRVALEVFTLLTVLPAKDSYALFRGPFEIVLSAQARNDLFFRPLVDLTSLVSCISVGCVGGMLGHFIKVEDKALKTSCELEKAFLELGLVYGSSQTIRFGAKDETFSYPLPKPPHLRQLIQAAQAASILSPILSVGLLAHLVQVTFFSSHSPP